MSMEPEILNVKEAAQLTKHTPDTIYSWVRDGLVRHHRVNGGRIMFDKRELLEDIGFTKGKR